MHVLTETWIKAFDALQYVTNPFALFGYLFLVLIIVLSILPGISGKLRFGTVLICGALVLLMAGFCMRSAIHTALYKVRDNSLVRLVRHADAGSVAITDRVAVKLIDIETLKGKAKPKESPGGHEFNKRLPDSKRIFEKVLQEAGVRITPDQNLQQMSQDDWDKFLNGLEPTKAKSVLDIPFVWIAVFVDGDEDTSFRDRRFFKGEPIKIPVPKEKPVTIKLVNVYNTKHMTSSEPEAVNVQVSTD